MLEDTKTDHTESLRMSELLPLPHASLCSNVSSLSALSQSSPKMIQAQLHSLNCLGCIFLSIGPHQYLKSHTLLLVY